MSYKPRTLFRLIEDINKSLFLPHIQRPFVWDEDQMRRLFDSLMRNYPIQTLLFWRTKDHIKARRFMQEVDWDIDLHDLYDKAISDQGREKVFVLDGQQRIQTLYALFAGSIKAPDGKTELHAYFDITSGTKADEGGVLYQISFRSADPGLPHYRLANLLGADSQKKAFDIAKAVNTALDAKLADDGEQRSTRKEQVLQNVMQLNSLLLEEKHFWVQELDGVANDYPYKQVLEIFIRVNSGGTKLDASDLMFAAMKEGWAEIEERSEEVVELLNDNRLAFDKEFVLKCLVVAHGKKAELSPEKFTSEEGDALLGMMEENWPKAEAAFQQLRDFIANDLQLLSTKVVRSYGSFIPLFDYLYHNPKPIEKDRVLMRAYYYKSQLMNWYRAQTDNIINVMHGMVGKPVDKFPLSQIELYFAASRSAETRLTKDHLADNRLRFILLNLIYVERFGKSPFNVRFKGNEPHVDHIYPQSMLRSRLGCPSEEINFLGNFRFVGATDNIRKRAELPASYFGRLKTAGVNIQNHLLLPDYSADPTKLLFDAATYRDFRTRRFEACWEIADRVVNPV